MQTSDKGYINSVRFDSRNHKMELSASVDGSNVLLHPKLLELDISTYQVWFQALASDDIEKISQTLKHCSPAEVNHFLYGVFRWSGDTGGSKVEGRSSLHWSPLALQVAVCSGARNVCQYFNQTLKADFTYRDEEGNNILHALVSFSYFYPDKEVDCCDMYLWLQQMLGGAVIRQLLIAENNLGLRPLEYAAHLGTIHLFKQLFATPKVYITKTETVRYVVQKWYDVTEYEFGGRQDVSPLLILTHLDNDILETDQKDALKNFALLRAWSEAKHATARPFIICWFILRLFLLLTYFILDFNKATTTDPGIFRFSNRTQCPGLSHIHLPRSVSLTFTVAAVCFWCAMVLFDIAEFFLLWCCRDSHAKLHFRFRQRKCFLVNHSTYRISHFIFCLTMAIGLPVAHEVRTPEVLRCVEFVQAFLPILAVWSFLFFLQAIPTIGHALICIKCMFKDIGNFLIIYVISIAPFATILSTFMQLHSTDGCLPSYSNFVLNMYNVFRLMLNMVDLTSLNLEHKEILYVVHVIYVFTVAVLLINFLIAQMSSTAVSISNIRDVIFAMTRVSIAVTVERRLAWAMQGLIGRLKRRYFTHLDGCYYLVIHEDA